MLGNVLGANEYRGEQARAYMLLLEADNNYLHE